MSLDRISNGRLVCRLLSLATAYRWGCVRLVAIQAAALALGVLSLALSGMAIDTLARHARGGELAAALPGLAWLDGRSAWVHVAAFAAAILAVAAGRAALLFFYVIDAARLLQRRLVVNLRAAVFGKLQHLGPRFYGGVAGGALTSRATDDVQSVRLFVDGVLLQMIVLGMSLACCLA
jgi:ATP-binding cassette, subfamily B, bacterial